jgi:hypothetical protein
MQIKMVNLTILNHEKLAPIDVDVGSENFKINGTHYTEVRSNLY